MICYRGSYAIFCKTFRQTGDFYFENLSQRQGQNNAATLNLLKSDSLRAGIFFGPAFAVDLTGVKESFFVIVSQTSFLHMISRVSANSLHCC